MTFIMRDPIAVSACGVHVRGRGMVGSDQCPACDRMIEDARTGPITTRKTITGRDQTAPGPKNPNARVRRTSSPWRGRQASMPASERSVARYSKTGASLGRG